MASKRARRGLNPTKIIAMFKRVVWTGVGYGLGVGSSMVVQRVVKNKVKKTVERYTPEHIRVEATERSKEAVNRVRDFGSEMVDVVQKARSPEFGYHSDDLNEQDEHERAIDLRATEDPSHQSRRRGRAGFNRHR